MSRTVVRFSRLIAFTFSLAVVMLTASMAWAVDPERQLKQLHHTSWTIRDGMPFAGVLAVAQTPDGFLWLASLVGGLHRFDGVQAVPVATEQLGDRQITALATDTRGALWMGFGTPQIARLTRAGPEFFDVPTTGLRTSIFSIVPDPDGSLWVATRDKIHHFDGRRWRVIEDPWPFTSSAFSDPGGVWGMALARDGTLWSKNVLGLYFLRRGTDAFEQAPPGYGGGMFDFATDAQGRLWTSDHSSKSFYCLPDLIPGEPVPPPQSGGAVPASMAGVLRLDRDGTLWNANRIIKYLHRAASINSPGTPDRLMARDGLSSDFPFDVFEDREGNIWVPTTMGLDRFRNAMIASEPDVLVRQQAPAMVATRDALFVYSGMRARIADPDGDAGGRLIRIRRGHRPEVVDGEIGQLTAIAAAPDGSLILAREGDLLRWRAGGVTRIAMPPELEGGHVVNLAATTDGIVVSFYQKGVHRLAAGAWTNITPSWAQPQDTATVAVDAGGAIWLLYLDGRIVRVDARRSTEFRSPIGAIVAVLADRDGMIFVSLSGIARFDGRTLQLIPKSRAPILESTYGIAQSGDDVWIATAGSIVRIDRTILLDAFAHDDAPLDYRLYDVSDGYQGGFPSETFNTHLVAGPDGRIWTFTPGGIGWFDPAREYQNTHRPPVVITSAAAQRQRYEMPRSLSLPSGTTHLQIDYTAPSLTMPERVRFRYKLDGVDKDWIEAGNRRQAFYTSLPPGEHRFRVIAANNDGLWNEEGASLEFTIAPTFLQSIWFKLLLATAVALLMWLTYRALLNQQATRLHKRFQIRIAERERIARELHDTLLQSVQSLILRFDLVAGRVPNDSDLYASVQEELRRAQDVVAEGRDRVRELRTRSKADLGRAVVEMSREIIHGEVPQLTLKEEDSPRVLHAVVRDELVLAAGEAIRNVVQHARANLLEIELIYGDSELRISILDDGLGIPPEVLTKAERPGHYGLIGMRERLERIGGRLRIHSREGGGTVVALTVPARAAYSDRHGLLKRLLYPRSTSSA